MKRFLTAAVAALFTITFAQSTFAHSHLSSSNPEDGDVVKEPLKEITLEFDGKIEEGSFIEVETKSGKAIEVQEIIISDGKLTGIFTEALPNDEYEVDWNILSADGHSLDGDFEFTVEATETTTEIESENVDNTNNQSSVQEESATEEVDDQSSTTTLVIIALIAVLLVGGFF